MKRKAIFPRLKKERLNSLRHLKKQKKVLIQLINCHIHVTAKGVYNDLQWFKMVLKVV